MMESHRDYVFTIHFAALSFIEANRNRYAYMLEGLSPEWLIAKDAHTATFTTLPAGNYTLRLAAANPEGTWNWDGVALPIVVLPPPWLSPYAYIAYALLAVGLLLVLATRQKRSGCSIG